MKSCKSVNVDSFTPVVTGEAHKWEKKYKFPFQWVLF